MSWSVVPMSGAWYGDTVIATFDVPIEQVQSLLADQMGRTFGRLSLAGIVSRASKVQFFDAVCDLGPDCAAWAGESVKPHLHAGWKAWFS